MSLSFNSFLTHLTYKLIELTFTYQYNLVISVMFFLIVIPIKFYIFHFLKYKMINFKKHNTHYIPYILKATLVGYIKLLSIEDTNTKL